jgi:transposase-like protein
MMTCPKCGATVKQNKIGTTAAGSQRYRCFVCNCKYTPIKKPHGHSPELRQQAIRMYVDGINLRRIGRHLGLGATTVRGGQLKHALRHVFLSKTVDSGAMRGQKEHLAR